MKRLFIKLRPRQIIVGLFLFVVLLIPLYSVLGFRRMARYGEQVRHQLLEPRDFDAIAKDIALMCQEPAKESHGGYTKPDGDLEEVKVEALPQSLQWLRPSHFDILPDYAEFEMLGGFDHCGYRLQLNDETTSGPINIWDLFYYSEGSEPRLLATVRLDKSAHKH